MDGLVQRAGRRQRHGPHVLRRHLGDDFPFQYHYPKSGLWTVKIQMKDKDMTKYSAETYSINFETISNPQVAIEPLPSYIESDNTASIAVTLNPFLAEEPLVVKLTITPPAGTNPGRLELSNDYKTVPAGLDPLAENEY